MFISQGVASEIALVDIAEDKLRGEMMDLQHGQAFTSKVKIRASSGMDHGCMLVNYISPLFSFS
jgi:malate/lactate dehydrogenase